MKTIIRFLIVGATSWSLNNVLALGTNLLSDPSFEGGIPNNTYYQGSTLLPGWSVLYGNVDAVGSPYWRPQNGSVFVDLDGYYQAGAISQNVGVISGQTYNLIFWLAGNPADIPIKTMNVLWGGVIAGHYTFDTTGKTPLNMGWTQYNLQLLATSSQMALEFASLDYSTSAWGPMIDNLGANDR